MRIIFEIYINFNIILYIFIKIYIVKNNYIKSYELFSKAKHSYNQLLIIITNKEKELPKQFVQTLRIKIKGFKYETNSKSKKNILLFF